jgi:large subunit ribosomal protein L21
VGLGVTPPPGARAVCRLAFAALLVRRFKVLTGGPVEAAGAQPDLGPDRRIGRLVQSLAVPKPDSSLSAVVVSGGKQYRVAPGDQILVDRIAAEPGSTLQLGRVLLVNDGGEVKVGKPGLDGVIVEAKVLAHPRGPRIESIRYKSKKRVRVHHGGRADLTALAIVSIGGATAGAAAQAKAPDTAEAEPKAKPKAQTKRTAAPKAAVVAEAVKAPAKRAPRKTKKESDGT